jgi:hypothetical protein
MLEGCGKDGEEKKDFEDGGSGVGGLPATTLDTGR